MLVIQNPVNRQPLKAMVESSRSQTLRCVRKDVDLIIGDVSIYTKLMVMNLCIPAVVSGDINAADVHLRALLALRPGLHLFQPLDSPIWWVARTCTICHAIQTSQSPLYPLRDIPTNDYRAVGYGHIDRSLSACVQNRRDQQYIDIRERRQSEYSKIEIIQLDKYAAGSMPQLTATKAGDIIDMEDRMFGLKTCNQMYPDLPGNSLRLSEVRVL